MNNKIAIFSDTHFGRQKNDEKILNYSIEYIKNIMIPNLKSQNITNIFFLGDLFDNRNLINVKVQNDLYDLFSNDFKDFQIYMLIGNHDTYYSNTTDTYSSKQFKSFKNIHIIEKFETINIENFKILMVSWLTNNSELQNIINCNPADVLMGHFDILGFHFNQHKICESGIDHNIFVDKFQSVFSGHFHKQSEMIVNNTKICYIGAPWQIDRNDIGESRGFIIYDIKNTSIERIQNLNSPKFINLNYPEISENIINNFVDITIKYNPENFEFEKENYNKYIETIETFKPFKLAIYYEAQLHNNLNPKNCVFSFKNLKDSFYKYLQQKNENEIIEMHYKFSQEFDKEMSRS